MFCPDCGSLVLNPKKGCQNCGWGKDPEEAFEIGQNRIQPKIVDNVDPDLPYFPYKARDVQREIIHDIRNALSKQQHIVIESGTGTGKTITSLSAALEYACENNKKIIYLTRTLSQTNQVMKELRSIGKIREVKGMALSGRGKSCPLLKTMKSAESMPPNILSRICEEEKKKANDGKGGCAFYRMMKLHLQEIEQYCLKDIPTSDEFDSFCTDMGACPYEAKRLIMKDVKVIAMPYIRILSKDIRDNFLASIESDGSNLIGIIDEAHNIIDAAREQESFSINMDAVEDAMDESKTFISKAFVYKDIPLIDFLNELKNSMKSFANERLDFKKKEDVLKTDELEERFYKRFSINRQELESCISTMMEHGQNRTMDMVDRGETNKISPLLTLAEKLRSWIFSDSGKFVKEIRAEDTETLRAACIDPHDVTEFIRSLKGAIHMSGTLNPLDQYVRLMELPPGTPVKTYPTPFPPENRLVLYVNDVSTKYPVSDFTKSWIRRYIVKLCNAVDKNTLVFFTSYAMMKETKEFFERDIKKPLYWEESGKQSKTMEALNRFRKGKNGVFFSVLSGSIAEGIDFPGEELCFAIIVGIPYRPPSLEVDAMTAMIDKRYSGQGYRYISEIPAIRKIQQAIGRLIRTDTDRGAAVILDSRAKKYAKEFGAVETTNPVQDVTEFFKK